MDSTSSASLIDIIPETKTARPKASIDAKVKPKETDKDRVRKVLDHLEDVMANLENSDGQGYLFTASGILLSYLQRS